MGIETLLKSMLNLSRPEGGDMGPSGAIPIPGAKADPSAVAEFSKRMDLGGNRENAIDGVAGTDRVQGHTPLDGAVSTAPATLGDRLALAGSGRPEESNTKQWLNTVTDILEKDAISLPDLYRVQVLAGMAQIETTRNSSINKSMDEGLKSVLKNS
jgi:hypothetical protein